MQTIRPAKNQLFCKQHDAEQKTASGLLLTGSATEAPKIAEVVNVGRDVTQFSQHDNIVYKSYSTTDIKLDGNDYFLIAEDDVLGTVVATD